jgi:ELWxxDGT repeat protein
MTCLSTVLSAQTFLKKFNTASSITAVGSKIFFVADDDIHGSELWITDGTLEGTRMVKDINPGFMGSEPAYLIKFNNELYFVANTLQFGNELWKSDGTTMGTVLVKDIYAGNGNGSDPRAITFYDGNLYFDASPDGFNRAVYKSDGTSAGTIVLKDAAFGEMTSIAVAGDYLYYVFGTNKLWRSDGTPGASFNVDVDSYDIIEKLSVVGNSIFLTTASPKDVNVRLYTLSGTNAPQLLKENNAPPSSTNKLTNLTAVDERLFYSVIKDIQPIGADELWMSATNRMPEPSGSHDVNVASRNRVAKLARAPESASTVTMTASPVPQKMNPVLRSECP